MRDLVVQLADLSDKWKRKGPDGRPWTAARFAQAIGYASRDGWDGAYRVGRDGGSHTIRSRSLTVIAANDALPDRVRLLARLCLLRRAVIVAYKNEGLSEEVANEIFPETFRRAFELGMP